MIQFEQVTFTYPGAAEPALREVDLDLGEGELVLVTGRTGVGKSTLLGAVNGLVPRFTGGHLRGRVAVAGQDTAHFPPQEFAHLVGVVGQDPLAGFVTDTVEDELAYGMEQLGLASEVMRKRVEETLDLLGIAELRRRALSTLSGGQQQRVALGSVLTAHPKVLVLDEPTSALDPTAAEDVLAAIIRLVHDLGTTVLVAEHRVERVVQYADRLLHLPGDGTVRDGAPAALLTDSDVAPPVVRLGRLAGWQPLPLSVRDARRRAGELRERLAGHAPPASAPGGGAVGLAARRLTVTYGATVAVSQVDLDLHRGEVLALMGRNGSGKSSLLWALQGSGPRRSGTVDVSGTDPGKVPARRARALVGLVPQTASDLLYLETVDAECAQSDTESGTPEGTCRALLDSLAPGIPGGRHPRDLSEGQKLALVLAVQLSSAPGVVLLDEPTRGLDYHAKARFTQVVRELAAQGSAVVVATHDVEFVAGAADRVAVMAEGEIVADGPTARVVVSSPAFAPQIAKVLAPQEWLTVEQIAGALAEEEGVPA
ncbi:cobalt/nickel ABC transporter ATPase [Streptomyces albus]|uniref:Cobalt/nickel ABC transporter ATPase n=1 Tax=Streptomyces albus (strain ATCC 21838 / DSM 41398 / FERM P-419 / JCM 4703 / NBRC 107858) TaxID=1081613 RepID=A0A0B5F9G8_STRA4|nr:cobalt/nickel ABC transporter ATPase [Streptomyces albus]AOU81427.1 cobalt/nickel ABC transporter ATPase [Streptomyces albus]AYN37120.1 cobalt ABC transporter ATP-binding protein [Streptomyces albus]